MPAACGRRMDAGAIGSLAADYPLKLLPPGDPRTMATVGFLLDHCMIEHGFFHDMTHSGINPYLTLHLAQVLLRAGDSRFLPLVRRIAELATPAGQWPEAVHPFVDGGCMGDGQHGWAAAEWVLMMRSLFLTEESEELIVGAGIPKEWLATGETMSFGPTPTPFGTVKVDIRTCDGSTKSPSVIVAGNWRGAEPTVSLALPDDCRAQIKVERLSP